VCAASALPRLPRHPAVAVSVVVAMAVGGGGGGVAAVAEGNSLGVRWDAYRSVSDRSVDFANEVGCNLQCRAPAGTTQAINRKTGATVHYIRPLYQ